MHRANPLKALRATYLPRWPAQLRNVRRLLPVTPFWVRERERERGREGESERAERGRERESERETTGYQPLETVLRLEVPACAVQTRSRYCNIHARVSGPRRDVFNIQEKDPISNHKYAL